MDKDWLDHDIDGHEDRKVKFYPQRRNDPTAKKLYTCFDWFPFGRGEDDERHIHFDSAEKANQFIEAQKILHKITPDDHVWEYRVLKIEEVTRYEVSSTKT